MRTRSPHGGTLAMVVSTTLVIALIGVAVFFLVKIFGGGRELQHATDSGNLNVAKEAILNPGVALEPGTSVYEATFTSYATNNGEINLTNYNQLVGQALLVALNAQADGSADAITNAQNLVNALQGPSNSIGARLKNALSNNANLMDSFHNTAKSNSIRMLGGNATLAGDGGAYKVAYLEQQTADTGASNLSLAGSMFDPNPGNGVSYGGIMAKALPTNFSNGAIISLPGNARANYNGTDYLRGYQGLSIPGVSVVFGVPLQPTQQPHLVSLSRFDANVNQPGGNNIAIPPNTFRNGAQATEEKSGSNASTISAAIVGALNNTFQPRIKRGFIVIDNSGTASYTGSVPNMDNVAAQEFTNGGIDVVPNTKAFSRNPGLLDTLRNNQNLTPAQQSQVLSALNSGNADNNLFRADGSKITSLTDAQSAVPYQGPAAVNCNHYNSGPGGVPDCNELLGNGSFDNAYHPGGGYGNPAGSNMLMAIESTKCRVYDAFNNAPGNCANVNADQTVTGLRAYGNGHNPILGQDAAYRPGVFPHNASDPNVLCKISSNGTVKTLINQTTAGSYTRKVNGDDQPSGQTPVSEFTRFITTCILQMKPNATASDFDRVLGDNAPAIELGSIYYVRLDNNDNVVVDQSAPEGLSDIPAAHRQQALIPDGKKYSYSATYTGYESVFDSNHDNNIHDHLFMTVNNTSPGGVMGTDTVSFQKASGAFNLLGVVKFTNQASGSAQLCDRN